MLEKRDQRILCSLSASQRLVAKTRTKSNAMLIDHLATIAVIPQCTGFKKVIPPSTTHMLKKNLNRTKCFCKRHLGKETLPNKYL